ncbi:MAG: InlB B-repeat-containing protein, partial [Lachnospiraceae bacterium]|nr:InlB B-repeat-containing protein [Lachnospiraceae bacterium]
MEAEESVSANEEAAADDSAATEAEETDADNEETETDYLSSEETGTENISSEAVNENGSDDVLTEEEVSTEEILSEEMSSGEEASEEEASETEEETDEEALKTAARNASTAKASGFSNVGGWNESIYAEIAGIADTDVTEVRYSGAISGALDDKDLNYLVRKSGSGVRIDIPGLKAGTYTLTVKVGQESVLTESGISVYAYDRSGYAHFKYNDGVGAYKDDGTLKDNAIVLYVTDKNKNDVELTVDNTTVKGIGNILNSVGQDTGGGKTSNGGKANTNQGIIKELAKAGKPLVVRFIGTVSDSGLYEQGTFSAASKCLIDGLTTYSSVDNGGTVGDNGHMARIQSGKDITLEGIGYDAVIDGWGFHYIAQTSDPNFGKSFEVRNLTFINTPEDAIGMEGQQASKNASSDLTASVERCWIHNNEFYCPSIDGPAESDKSEGDGSVDFKRGQYFTCSYNYFDSCHKTNLVGSADYSLQFNLTYHHNYWYMCKARGPLTRRANVHMYNNVWDMQTDYAENTRADAYIFSEYNIFYACKSPQAVEGGAIKSYNDSISSVIWNKGSAGTVVTDKSEYVSNSCQFSARNIKYDKFDTDSSQSYIPGNDYQLQTDFTDLRKVIAAQTGVQDKNPKRPESVSKSEYSVVGRMAGDNIHKFDSLPQTLTPGKISKSVYAFEVGAAFDLEITYENTAKGSGVLVNEEGENLLAGDGSAIDLPAGRYMIQAENFQPGDPQKGTIAVFKDITIGSLKISQHDPNAHYHKWKLDTSKSLAATCTDTGKSVYTCEGTGTCGENGVKEEVISALGHSYTWIIDKPATAEETGLKHQECTRCHDKTNIDTEIPKGTAGGGTSGGNTGGSTAAGDYELYFTGRKTNGDTDFFTVANGSYKSVTSPVTVNDVPYTDGLKMESKTEVSFSCNDGATLFMAFDGSGKKVKVDGEVKTTDSKGIVTVELSAGLHKITKGDSMNLFYVSVANGASQEVYYTLSFEYNYDDSPDAKTVQVIEGKTFASMSELVPSSFSRAGYTICGLFTDSDCTKPLVYPYRVNANATLYADWEASGDDEVAYSLIFNSNGGSAVATVRIASGQIYEIKQKPTRNGYAFAGWYDALEGGNLVDKVDGSKLTGNYTVYAHWNTLEEVKLSLDCSKLEAGNIKEKTNLNNSGFIAHALEGGVGTAGDENPKYYMTVKDGGLYTNGLRLTDTSIAGNEDGLLKTIEFTTEGSGVLSVETALSGKPATGGKYELVLAKKSSNGYEEVGRQAITTGTTKTTKEFDISGAGTYYLYAEGDKGVVYYSLKVTEQLYTIIFQTGNGTAPEDLKVSSFTARAGEEITIPSDCMPAAGYIFKGWSADDGATILKDVYKVKEEDATGGTIIIAALYEAKQFTIKYDANGGTLPAGMQATATVKTGERIVLGNCTPAAGYQFLGWSLGHSGEIVKSPYIVNVADADENDTITLKAVYGPEGEDAVYYTVTLDTDGGTLVDGGGRERLVLANTAIDPGECEKVGYVFKGWTIDGKDVKLPYTVTSDVTMKARYGLSDETEQPEQHDGIYIVGLLDTYDYTGAKIIPNIGVMDYDVKGGKLLTPGVDYTVKYKDNVKAGATATVAVTGKGNYEGQDTERSFKIEEVKTVTELEDLKGVKLSKIGSVQYTGEEQYPAFTLTKGGIPIATYSYHSEEGVYKAGATAIKANVALSNNINKGTATILISGAKDSKGNPTRIKGTFKITPIDLQANEDKVTVKADAGTYAVKGAVPESITVTYDGRTLINGTDYTVKYSGNKKAGVEGNVIIAGKGNYTKKCTTKYDIVQLD